MANQRDLDRVRVDLKAMFDKAYVLPDGRRVFKTEDGLTVFDETGDEMHDLDPAEIEDWRPRWEKVVSGRRAETELLEERHAIHDYQAKLDASREQLSKDGLTDHELKELEQSLNATMPERVRRQLGDDAPAPEPGQDAAPARSAVRPGVNLGMPTL